MLSLRVRYFGILVAHAGRREETVPVADGSTVTDLLHHLVQMRSGFLSAALFQGNTLSPPVRIIHNQRPLCGAGQGRTLADGDEILLFPIVSGG